MAKERLDDLIKFSISKEREAALTYEKYSTIVTSDLTKQLLKDMAAMERGHEKKLIAYSQKGKGLMSERAVVVDLHITDFMPEKEITKDSSVQDVFVACIQAEQKAFELYSKLEQIEIDSSNKDLFHVLALEEKKHKLDLESEYEKIFMKDN